MSYHGNYPPTPQNNQHIKTIEQRSDGVYVERTYHMDGALMHETVLHNQLLQGVAISGCTTTNGVANITFGLDDDEKAELAKLQDQREHDKKSYRLNQFKNLPATMRQQVINDILWTRTTNEMEHPEVPKSTRQQELEAKELPSSKAFHAMVGYHDLYADVTMKSKYDVLLKWFTEKEIIDAHNDASAEEALLGD